MIKCDFCGKDRKESPMMINEDTGAAICLHCIEEATGRFIESLEEAEDDLTEKFKGEGLENE